MSRLPNRLFGFMRSSQALELPETTLRELTIENLYPSCDANLKTLLRETRRSNVSLPTFSLVHREGESAFVLEVELRFARHSDTPNLDLKGAFKDTGKVYPQGVFVSEDAFLDFSEGELIERIEAGEIGSNVSFLPPTILNTEASFGDNCVIGPNSRVFGGFFGKNVYLGADVWISPGVEVAGQLIIGKGSSLSGEINIGFAPDNIHGEKSGLILVGDSCALERCAVLRNTVIGKHCLVEGNPTFSGYIPDGATVVASGDKFLVVPY